MRARFSILHKEKIINKEKKKKTRKLVNQRERKRLEGMTATGFGIGIGIVVYFSSVVFALPIFHSHKFIYITLTHSP